jgi:hypothetical protein
MISCKNNRLSCPNAQNAHFNANFITLSLFFVTHPPVMGIVNLTYNELKLNGNYFILELMTKSVNGLKNI